MNKFLFFLLTFTFLTACNPTDPPVEDPIVYPVIYEKMDYDFQAPLYWLIEEGLTTSSISPSTRFADYVSYFETEEYPEIFDFFYTFESIQLLSDTTADVVTYNSVDQLYDTSHLFYERTMDEIILRDSQSIFEYSIEIDLENNRLINCDVIFTNTYFDQFSNQIEYTGYDGSPCTIFPTGDLVSDYLATSSNISAGDTLAQINISGYFKEQ